MQIGLIPLDERPVNTRYPAMIAQIAGAEVVQPTPLSHIRTPADCDRLAAWLREQAASLHALIVSIQMLGYGGLIASRTTHDSAAQIIARLEVLREIKRLYPHLRIYGFDLITRISFANDNFEEPLYWDTYGIRLYMYSQLLDRQLQGEEVRAELDRLQAEIPPEHLQDFLARRLRNHTVNLAVFELLTSGVFDLLILSSDDTSEYGLGTREKRWLTEWASRLSVGDRLLMYPGADEVGCALLARAINRDSQPRFYVHYSIPGDEDITAPFEDGAVRITVERQVRAVGGVLVDDSTHADFILAVNTPSPSGVRIFDPAIAESERAYRAAHLLGFVHHIKDRLDAGRRVILADVAYPNGADPVLVSLLREHLGADITKLSAYGGWNTAGNTIGTALAQGVASSMAHDEKARRAAEQFLLHRFVEDWGFMHVTRPDLSSWLVEQNGTTTITAANFEGAKALIEFGLQSCLDELPGFSGHWRIVPSSIRLPWVRTFEVDFDLEHV
jgi:hypothetical protein